MRRMLLIHILANLKKFSFSYCRKSEYFVKMYDTYFILHTPKVIVRTHTTTPLVPNCNSLVTKLIYRVDLVA